MDLPDIEFPPGIQESLREYVRLSGDEISYIAQIGVEQPIPGNFEEGTFWLYAAYENVKRNPQEGLAVIYLALVFDSLGDIDNALAVLNSLDRAGCLNLYKDVAHDDPAFLAGFWSADAGRLEEALPYYERCLARQPEKEHGVILSHLGSVYHQLGQFEAAQALYQKARQSWTKELVSAPERLRTRENSRFFTVDEAIRRVTEKIREQLQVLTVLGSAAEQHHPFSGQRGEWGITLLSLKRIPANRP